MPLRKVKHYAIRVEFQFMELLHIHSFLWVINTSTLNHNSMCDNIELLDCVIFNNLPSEKEDLDL